MSTTSVRTLYWRAMRRVKRRKAALDLAHEWAILKHGREAAAILRVLSAEYQLWDQAVRTAYRLAMLDLAPAGWAAR